DGVDVFVHRPILYKRVIPLGLNVLLHFIPSVEEGRGGFLIQTYKVFEDYRFLKSRFYSGLSKYFFNIQPVWGKLSLRSK
ncbi:MAG: hypothetical protein ACK6BZ_09380, partial [Candidatus Kapaibacterium sp.]